MHHSPTSRRAAQAAGPPALSRSGRQRSAAAWLAALVCAATITVTSATPNPELISVDFVVSGSGGDGSGHTAPCAGDTVLTGTTMNNAVGNLYSGQVGNWNHLNLGTYNQSSALSGFLTNGSGTATSAKLALGQATGLTSTAAGGWRCSPNEGTPGATQQLRAETAYLYNGVITGDHFAWAFTGLIPNSIYRMTFFGGDGNPTGASNVADGVAGTRDSEGDWNWASLTADSNGTILGTFTAPNPTLGLYGVQLEHLPRTQPPQSSPGTPAPADGTLNVPTFTSLGWSTIAGAETYDVYLWPSSGAQPAVPTATVTTGQFTPPGFLLALTSYSWQVLARNPAGVMNSPVWSFTTDDGRPLAPTTPAPAEAATNVLVETLLDWDDSLGANSYQVFVWLASESKPATPAATVTSSRHLLAQPLLGNSRYNWQVVAVNANGATNSALWSFTTGERYPGYLVPWPMSVTMGAGDFTVTSSTRIVAEDAQLLPLAQVMARDFFMAAGLGLTTMQGPALAGDIALRFNPDLSGEAYTLEVNGTNIVLSGGNYQAVAWASVTLLQAFDTSGTPAKVPQMLIADQAAAPLRTVMWDVGRFFHPLETLYEFVDLHRMYKVTYLHLFMSADGLFTFGTELPALAALRKTSSGNSSAGFYLPPAGSRLYYTKAELSALVEYAKNRGVIIVPEIDTPSWAALMTQTLPAVFCSAGGTTVTHDLNLNYSTAVTAMEDLIAEMAAVFSTSPYIHIGADEVPTAEFETYPYYATSKVTNNYASGGEGLVWYLHRLDAKLESLGKSSWAWSAPGAVGKGYDMRPNLVYTAWGYDDGQNASQGGYSVMRAAGGHVAGYGQASRAAPYNRCLLYRPAQGIYNRLTPLLRFIGAPDNMYTDLTPTFLPLTGREHKILGAHIMEWETPYEVEVPAMRLSMPALGEPTWNQQPSPRRNWDNFLMRQQQTDRLYQRVMRPVNLSVTTQVDPKDACFVAGGMVTMTSPVAGTIRYTVGTNYTNSWYNFPTNTSTAYTGPFAITQSSVISARLFDAAGTPLGNPVTRGFYLITPRIHYKYFFTGTSPAADFEQGTPIVSSVMGQMVGDAPQEDVRFGDGEHRTVYSGALNIPTTGAYTFAASYGGTITIDRVPLADGTPLALAAGEHLVKIVTPASGLDTPYTYSGPGASAGTDINNLLKTLNTCSQVFPLTWPFGTRSLSLGATDRKEITIVNHSVAADLTITSVQLAGANAGEFLISEDSGETVLAPGAERIVAVRFNPATAGSKTATLHVVAANLPGGAADASLTGTAVLGTLPAIPATPAPATSASGVSVNPTLDWADAAGATSYDVYLWLASGSKPATASATVAVSQWTPPATLTNGVNYHWQVVAINSNGSTSGPQWAFHTGTSTVQFSNLTDGQVLRHSMVLVDGTFDGGATLTITAAPVTAALAFTKYGTRFRCLVDLRPGTNTLTITDGHGPVALNLVFTPPTASDYRFKVWYVVPSDEANSPVDPDWLVHFSLQAKLMQSWMAEDQQRAGNGRLTFYPELDAASNVSVEKLVLTQTRAQATALNTAMYGEVWNQLPAGYKNGLHKNLAFSSVAFNALGSGDLCYVGAYTNFHPANATEMMTKLLSTQLGNDNALTYSTYAGVTLHEMIHCLHSIWHDTSANNIMGGGGYDISQYFTLTYSASNPAPHGESSAGTLGTQRDLAAWNRYLMSADPHVYNNTTVDVTAGPEYLTATSAYPLAVFQYYIPNAAADLHVNLAAVPVTTYGKHAGQARLELGASPFNVMAVDTEGNMSYNSFAGRVPVVPVADSYTVSAGASVIAAPGVLGNDLNPSVSTLTAQVATTVQHGTLALNSNGGFTYTPTTGYVGSDTFSYRVSDGISSDQSALVTLTVTAVQMTQPTAPLPATGATGVAVNTALDWADVSGATGYDVYLWVTAQTKPATPTANVAASSYVPPASLLGTTAYSWQVVARNESGSVAGPAWTFSTQAQANAPANLISIDFIYSVAGSNPYAGDTVLTGTLNNNAVGLVFTGQTGAWNGVNVGGSNANVNSASLSNLRNGTGTATTISFTMGHATSSGAAGGDWRNNPVGAYGNLRQEQPYLYNGVITSDHYDWEFAGLTPNAHYSLVVFASTGALSHVANGVAGFQDAEGDWNWADLTATAAGRITGRFTDNTPTSTPGLYGLQLYRQATAAALAANAGPDQSVSPATLGGSPVASGGTAPYTYNWSPGTGLTSATVANPGASPGTTTTYTVTVTDFLGATASDSVTITVGGAPAPTTTTLTSSPVATGSYGTAVTLSATVFPAASGTVLFKDGATELGSGTLGAGLATFTTSATTLAMGVHSITAAYQGSTSFEPSTSAAFSYTVSAKPLTITGVTAANKVYDGTTGAVLTGGTVAGGVLGTEIVTIMAGTGAFASANVGSQAVTATGYALGGADVGNYVLSAQPGVANASITARPVRLTGTRVYDATAVAAAGVLAVSNNLDGANLTLTGSANLAGKEVGSQALATGAAAARVQYKTGTTTGANFFTVTLNALPASGNTLLAVVTTRRTSISTVSSITASGGVTWVRAKQSAGTAGTTTEIWYAPNVQGAAAGVTINLAASNFAAAAVVAEYSGVLASNPLDTTASNNGTTSPASTGTTTTTAQANELWFGGIGFRGGGSYTYTVNSGSLASFANAQSGTTSSSDKVYALDYVATATGAAGSAGTLGSATTWSGAIATFRTVTPGTLALAGAAAGNYTLTGATGSVEITPKMLIGSGLGTPNRPYDGTAVAMLTGTATLLTAVAAGAGTASDGKPHSGDAVTLGGTAAGAFADKHVGSDKPVTVTGTTLGGAQTANYTLTQQPGLTANITPLPLTVSAVSTTKTYDGTLTAAGTPTLAPPLAAGDLTGTLAQAFEDGNAGVGTKVIIPSITIDDGNSGANYAVTVVNDSTGTIHPAAAIITLGNLTHTYDGNPQAVSASTTPEGLAVDLTYDGVPAAPSAVGSYAVVANLAELNYTGTASGTLVIAAESIIPWREAHFTADEITAGLAADGVDPDGDGFTNLAEYTLGTDPRSFSPPPLALTHAADNTLTLTFLARRATGAGHGGLTRKYLVEVSSDLANPASWQGVTGFLSLIGDGQTVTVPVPGAAPRQFYRLTVRLE
ncbi:MAG: YDG domain-containing protein [Verrucomicrobia bacterium]|nr:YDG domain-containing protein [Verrucomicrobiota bacterium]